MQTDVGMFFYFINDIQPEGCLSRYFWMNAHICIKNICFEIQLPQVESVPSVVWCGVVGSNKSHTVRGPSGAPRYIIRSVITLIIFTQLNTTQQSRCLALISD